MLVALAAFVATVQTGRSEDSETASLEKLLRQVNASGDRIRRINQKTSRGEFARFDFGFAGSPNFTVIAPRGEFLASRVLENAESYRDEISKHFIGGILPAGQERAHIHVTIVADKDEALTLLSGTNKQLPGDHRIWLKTSREMALGPTLKHEVAHVVLNARFPNGMPAWANEGLASSFDDRETKDKRTRTLRRLADQNRLPTLARTLSQQSIRPTDQVAYTIACSVTDFLVAQDDVGVFLKFVDDLERSGLDVALSRHYKVRDTSELQMKWKEWVASRLRSQ